MGLDEVQRIKDFFAKHHLHPTYLEHEPVITSEDAARTRGFALKQGIKAIVATDGANWAIIDVPADRKVDLKKAAETLGWSKGKIRMATPDEVMAKTGCEVGAVPPFGHKEMIQVLVDIGVYDNQESAFNIGVRTQSVKIKTEEMKKVFSAIGAKEGTFAK
jgi:prolyl-tRNA editing enzyme YbaK/EbsC (Cys-tRNA(Pro) deacylase)